jgi:hypothetical protein
MAGFRLARWTLADLILPEIGFRREYRCRLMPTLIFFAVFFAALPAHPRINQGLCAFGWHPLLVPVKGLHRLAFPRLYPDILALKFAQWLSPPLEAGLGMVCISITILPLLSLTYPIRSRMSQKGFRP